MERESKRVRETEHAAVAEIHVVYGAHLDLALGDDGRVSASVTARAHTGAIGKQSTPPLVPHAGRRCPHGARKISRRGATWAARSLYALCVDTGWVISSRGSRGLFVHCPDPCPCASRCDETGNDPRARHESMAC